MKRQIVSFKTNIVFVSCSLYSGNEIIHEFGFGFVQAYAWYMNLDYLSLVFFKMCQHVVMVPQNLSVLNM
jgi:hypothetical protein